MNALKEPERITLVEGLTLLERHVPTAPISGWDS